MTTRCYLYVSVDNKPAATIYRHCDGYPTGMGQDIVRLLTKEGGTNLTDFVANVLDLRSIRGTIELEAGKGSIGGTDYTYYVNFPEFGDSATVKIMREHFESDPELVIFGTPEEVYEWILEEEKRLKELEKKRQEEQEHERLKNSAVFTRVSSLDELFQSAS